MTKKRIEPGWRMALAQACLRMIFARRWHYISPWKKAGVASVLLPIHQGKVLLGLRQGNIEHAGCWSGLGGFVEFEAREGFAEGLVRELWEETRLWVPLSNFPDSPMRSYLKHGQSKLEEADCTVVVGYYLMEVDSAFAAKLTPQEETGGFAWFDEATCEQMMADQRIPNDFYDLHDALRHVFAELKRGTIFPKLKLA